MIIRILFFTFILILNINEILTINQLRTYNENNALQYIRNIDSNLLQNYNALVEAHWKYATNLTEFNKNETQKVSTIHALYVQSVANEISKYSWQNFQNEDLKLQFKLLSDIGYAKLPHAKHISIVDKIARMESNYASVRICSYTNETQCTLKLHDIERILRTSNDTEEMKYYWKAWYDKAGTPVRKHFKKYIKLKNKAARLNNYTSAVEYWLRLFEDNTIEEQLENIFNEIKPLYNELHGYVRWRLRQHYGTHVLSRTGPIPIHLLGNIFGNDWKDVAHIAAPFPDKPMINVTDELVKQNYTALRMFQLADGFFQSINMSQLPSTFWSKSIIEDPKDGRNLVCHASAWDFGLNSDVRIKQCTRITMGDFRTIHHEMGHIQYFLQYQNLSYAYRINPNPGVHEAVGDVIALSVMTPKHLQTIDLLKNYTSDEETRINTLFLMALQKIAKLPSTYSFDKYRWGLFRGQINESEMNCAFWKLREQYAGLEPAVKRDEGDFDPTALYHVSADVDFLRYYIAIILQFQFYEAACRKAQQFDPNNSSLPLDKCDFYGSTEAGNSFKAMLELASSKPLPDIMEKFTDERIISGRAIMEYFKPLMNWLKNQNERNHVYIGWGSSNKCDLPQTPVSSE